MISKTSVFLTIVGTVAVNALLPTRVTPDSGGWGYAIQLYPNGTYVNHAYSSFFWDLESNCYYMYGLS
jgi:hypothetical protein